MLCWTLGTVLLMILLNHLYCCKLWTIMSTSCNDIDGLTRFNNIVNNTVHWVQHNIVHSWCDKYPRTQPKIDQVVESEVNNVVLRPTNSIVNKVVEPCSTINIVATCWHEYWWFNNIVNNTVRMVQHNIVHSCFKRLVSTQWFLRV